MTTNRIPRTGTRKQITAAPAISTVPRIWSPIASLQRVSRELRNDV